MAWFISQAGTEEGYVCIFDIVDSGIMYDKSLEKQEGLYFLTIYVILAFCSM